MLSTDKEYDIELAKKHLQEVLLEQFERLKMMDEKIGAIDFRQVKPIVIGIAGGDGIGPIISQQTIRILKDLLKEESDSGKIVLKEIHGLTIENRIKSMRAVPDDVMEQLKECHVLLKGPTTTPEAGSSLPNIESANVFIRKAFDLFANVRPIRVPKLGIDWVFFRENTEGEYILGNKGLLLQNELALDFKVITKKGARRIIRAAFDYARKTKRNKLTVVTKANVIKTTDGLFLQTAREVAKEYPDVQWDSWYVDVFAAKLIDQKRRRDFKVVVLPNLYGDIITDEAAEFQGGVGTAGSANIGSRYAMFEAIHGSAPRMIEEGRGQYADPSSLMRAAAMMLEHIGLYEKAERLHMALDICCQYEARIKITGRPDGATSEQFTDYVLETLNDPRLSSKWNTYKAKESGAI
ncbi:MAG: isocitrate/isopropylmalate family dehydrogenase [Conexivisphaerales archaeon]